MPCWCDAGSTGCPTSTGEPLRRDEHDHPGSLIHVDVTEFGNISDGGGWRYVVKVQGDRNSATTTLRTGRTEKGNARMGPAFVHTVIDEHPWVPYAEICTGLPHDQVSFGLSGREAHGRMPARFSFEESAVQKRPTQIAVYSDSLSVEHIHSSLSLLLTGPLAAADVRP